MTAVKSRKLKESMCEQFAMVFELCKMVMDSSTTVSLLNVTLQTLLCFLNWIPIVYIFQSDLIPDLVLKFLPAPNFRNMTLKCLSEIAAVTSEETGPKMLEMFGVRI